MQRRKLNNFRKPVLDRIYQVDGQECTFREWVDVNFYTHMKEHRDVTKVSANQVQDVVGLEPGQFVFIGITEIKRIS